MKLALLQLNSGADMAANIARVGALVAQAAGQGAELIATPENTFLMEEAGAPRENYTQENHPGILAAQEWARECRVWILLGSVAVQGTGLRIQGSGGSQQTSEPSAREAVPHASDSSRAAGAAKCYNRSLLLTPEGAIAATYDKIHLFDVDVPGDRSYRESDRMLAGEKVVSCELQLVSQDVALLTTQNSPLTTTLGLSICYDLRFPHLYRALAKMGANILAVPAAFTQVTGEAHWHVLLRARAIENGCFVIAPAQTGTHPGNRKTYGHSLVVNPWGEVIADGSTEEGIVMAEIDLGEVEKVRARLPSLAHDRPFT